MTSPATIALGVYMLTVLASYAALFALSLRKERKVLATSSAAVTILAPTTDNDAKFIVSAVQKFLTLANEVVIVCDGGTQSLFALQSAFSLTRMKVQTQSLPHRPITGVWVDGRLTVIHKISNRSKGDSVNAGLELVTTPLVFVCDADSILQPDTILKAANQMERDNAVACGLPLVPSNHEGVIAKFQIGEYARAMTFRKGWNKLGLLVNISGGAGLFCTDVLKAHPYDVSTCAEDLVATWSLLRAGHKLTYAPSANVGTEVPYTLAQARSQRTRWHRGLFEALFTVLPTKLNKYLAFWLWMFFCEAIEPLVEVAGIVWLTTHHISTLGWWTLSVGVLSTVLLTMACGGKCFYALLELSFKAATILWRIAGAVKFVQRDRSWEPIRRQEITQS